ncbi:MAG TPA: hypothetical protein VFO16_05770 [Pseudonocardiaceae bacterium]|nr:hypothetical protein [Pseudonocardiaceae bacterium]
MSVLGISLLATGAVAVFVTTNSVGASALIAAGTVVIALALFANQLESVEGGGVKLQLRAVESKLEEARLADAAGDIENAARLRTEAQLLFSAIEPIASKYEEIRESSPYSRERTEKMSDLVRQARQMANLGFVSPEAIEQLFDSDQDGNRIVALGLMRGEPRYANANIAVKAIRRPRSGFEQYQALRICQDLVAGNAGPGELKAIREAIAVAGANGSLDTRRDLADEILAAMVADQRGDQQ